MDGPQTSKDHEYVSHQVAHTLPLFTLFPKQNTKNHKQIYGCMYILYSNVCSHGLFCGVQTLDSVRLLLWLRDSCFVLNDRVPLFRDGALININLNNQIISCYSKVLVKALNICMFMLIVISNYAKLMFEIFQTFSIEIYFELIKETEGWVHK